MEPGNQWFVTGSADRTIKVMNIVLYYNNNNNNIQYL